MKSRKPTFEQMEEFFAQVKAGRITKENFQKFIFNPSVKVDADSYIVTVDRKLSLPDAIAAGKYDWKNDNITDKNFPLLGSQPQPELP